WPDVQDARGAVGFALVAVLLAAQCGAALTLAAGFTRGQKLLLAAAVVWGGFFLTQFSVLVLASFATTFTWMTLEYVVIRRLLERRTTVELPAIPGAEAASAVPLASARTTVLFDPVEWARRRFGHDAA